jgi:proteasome lid subunit RPN8/RPN11
MRSVTVRAGILASVRRFAAAAYPEECCGFLFAPAQPANGAPPREIVDVVPAANEVEGERRRRFIISPKELQRAEERAASAGQVVAGFYHSHPDHPARPSRFDAEHAWPWYTYLVVSVDRTPRAHEVGAFELDPERQEFAPVDLQIASSLSEAVGTEKAREDPVRS